MKYPSKEQQLKNLKNLEDDDIDYSDIPPITEDMLKNSVVTTRKMINGQLTITSQMPYLDVIKPRTKKRLHARIDSDVLEWFKQQGKGYQTHIITINNHNYYNAFRIKAECRIRILPSFYVFFVQATKDHAAD